MPKASRHDARILALQIVYSRSKIGKNLPGEKLVLEDSQLHNKYIDFANLLVDKTWDNLKEIDGSIQKHLKNWKQDRLTGTLNALLRISVAELKYFSETERKVVFNEAIELCREFVDEKATKMCNGVLHSVANDVIAA